jgi:uncharacterized membrane protein
MSADMKKVCPPEKPICFRKGRTNKKKSIEYRCDGQEYDIFGAMNQAFYINDGKKDEELKKKLDGDDSVDQCVGQPLNNIDCFCSPFDFAWMSAISEAKRRIGSMSSEKLINKPTKAATKEVAETMKKSMTKPNLTIFFTHISNLMKKNIPKITQGNPIYVEIFCACLDGALSINNTTEERIVNVIKDIILKAKPPNNIDGKNPDLVLQGTTIYNSLKKIVEIEQTINSVITNTNIADEIEKTMETQLNNTVTNNNELNELNQKLTDTVKLINIGNYVTNNSNHFDKQAFEETVETFKIYQPISSGGGKIWDYVKTNKWNILGGIVAGCAAAAALVTPVGWAATVVGVVIGAVKVYITYREKKNAIREAIEANDTETKEKCASILAAEQENTDPPVGGKKRYVSKKKQTKRKRKYNISKKYNKIYIKKYIKKYKTRRK